MPDLFSGSQYSSGWKPIQRSDEVSQKLNSTLEVKLKEITCEFDKARLEYEQNIKKLDEELKTTKYSLNKKITELTSVIEQKDEEIHRLSLENAVLNDKCQKLLEELLSSNEKETGLFTPLLKKILERKSPPSTHMHSID